MAKQSGIHQLRGKVGEMSYYRQSGIEPGLVRRINQGLSSRVKTDDAYANTRLNNREFGNAGQIAGALGQVVVPKWRPMFLNLSQSRLVKRVLQLIKQDTTAGTTWGTRGITAGDWGEMLNALNVLAKNPFEQFIAEMTIAEGANPPAGRASYDVTVNFSPDASDYLGAIGCQSARIYFNVFNLFIGRWDTQSNMYQASVGSPLGVYSSESEMTEDENITLTYRPSGVEGSTDAYVAQNVISVIVVPLREVNGVPFEMQEYATFRVFATPQD